MLKKKKCPLIGRKIKFVPAYREPLNGQCTKPVTGTIIWVHPKGRFVVVEYECSPHLWREHSEKIRECLLYPTETGLIEG